MQPLLAAVTTDARSLLPARGRKRATRDVAHTAQSDTGASTRRPSAATRGANSSKSDALRVSPWMQTTGRRPAGVPLDAGCAG